MPSASDFIPPEARAVIQKMKAERRRFYIQVKIAVMAIVAFLVAGMLALGLDFRFMAQWTGFIMAGIGYTLLVSVLAILLASILSLAGALGRMSTNPVFNAAASCYVSFIRGTPLLVQVYMWYLALPQVGRAFHDMGLTGIQKYFTLPAIVAGIIALGVCYGAYMTEIVRAGIQSVSIGQIEAAQALGMTRSQTLRRIIFPQAFKVIIPPISNEFIAMIKDSSLVSIMGVWELSYRAVKIGRRHFQSLEMLILVAGIYWVMSTLLQLLQERIEANMAKGEIKR